MQARAYVETSIPSFYFEVRTEPEMLARRDWTRAWWSANRGSVELVASVAVIDELGRGDFPARASCLELISTLPIVAVDRTALEIVEAYIRHRVMPADPAGDALHFNANKFGHIRRVNGLLGLHSPSLVTPLELLGDDDEE